MKRLESSFEICNQECTVVEAVSSKTSSATIAFGVGALAFIRVNRLVLRLLVQSLMLLLHYLW